VLVGFSAVVVVVERWLTQSPTLGLAHTALLVASSAPIYRHRNPDVSMAGSSDDPLLDTVRSRLTSGALFLMDRKGRARRGSGKYCTVCHVLITAHEIEYEVAGGSYGTVFAHLRCYLVWRQESEALHLSLGRRPGEDAVVVSPSPPPWP
jgi:hypothetical protein